jgi:hypothetical protein
LKAIVRVTPVTKLLLREPLVAMSPRWDFEAESS